MRISLKVTYEDGREVEAIAKPKDIVAFERQYGVAFAEFFVGRRYEWLCYLAWSPLNRQGREPRPFDEFMDFVDDVESLDSLEAVEPVLPFEPEASAETSPA